MGLKPISVWSLIYHRNVACILSKHMLVESLMNKLLCTCPKDSWYHYLETSHQLDHYLEVPATFSRSPCHISDITAQQDLWPFFILQKHISKGRWGCAELHWSGGYPVGIMWHVPHHTVDRLMFSRRDQSHLVAAAPSLAICSEAIPCCPILVMVAWFDPHSLMCCCLLSSCVAFCVWLLCLMLSYVIVLTYFYYGRHLKKSHKKSS